MNPEEFREFCLSFPGATEEIQWGSDLLFKVGGKVFVFTGADAPGLSIKCTDEDFDNLTSEGHFTPSKYLARYKWASASDYRKIPKQQLTELVRQSYDLVVSKLPKSKRPAGL